MHDSEDRRRETPGGSGLLHELFFAWAAAQPDAVAVVQAPAEPVDGGDEHLSYGELARRATALAGELTRRGLGPEAIVGLALDRGGELLAAILGTLLAGGAYLPLDPQYPAERLEAMLADSRAALLLSRRARLPRLPAVPTPTLWLDDPLPPAAAVACRAVPAHLAYVIYTSGSTGRPKGVLLAHAGAHRFARQVASDLATVPGRRVLHVASPSFDASVLEIWAALAGGATLLLPDGETRASAAALGAFCQRHAATTVFLTPALAAAVDPARLAAVTHMATGGDRCPPELVARWASGRVFWNAYGPTEATVYCTIHRCAPGDAAAGEVPIGRAIPGAGVHLLDRHGREVAAGEEGEIAIAGLGLARGYLGRPGLTADLFRPRPSAHHPSTSGERVYKSGDLGRRRADGELEFRGRIDHQIKLRGHRIEPGEVEAALAALPGVAAARVVAREIRLGEAAGERRLVAYCVPAPGSTLQPEALTAALAARLPAFLVPSAIVVLAALPLTASGKVDLGALPEPEWGSSAEPVAPEGEPEERLAAIWSSLLGGRAGRTESFFALGASSLLAARLLDEIERIFGVRLRFTELLARPTIAGLAEALAVAARVPAPGGLAGDAREAAMPRVSREDALARVPRGGDGLAASFAQERMWFLDQMAPGSPLYSLPAALRLSGRPSLRHFRAAMTAVLGRHEALRTTFESQHGQPRQVIHPTRPVPLPVVDLAGLAPADRESGWQRLAEAEARRPFDLARGPLLRLRWLRLGDGDHVLLINLHHVIGDGGSMGVLLREVSAAYVALAAGREPALPELPVQYADFAAWQRERQASAAVAAQLAWWREELRGAPALLRLPLDFPRPAVAGTEGRLVRRPVERALATALRTLARDSEATFFVVTLAAFAALLGRLGGQEDVLVGTPVAGRTRPEVAGLIGLFVNTLAVRARLKSGEGEPLTFRQLARRLQATMAAAIDHQEVPLERLVDELKIARSLAHNPLFQALFVIHDVTALTLRLGEVAGEPLDVATGIAKLDLTLILREEGEGGLTAVFEYRTDLFRAATIEGLADAYLAVLATVAGDPDVALEALPVAPAAPAMAEGAEVPALPAPAPPVAEAAAPAAEDREAEAAARLSSAEQRVAERRAGLSDAKRAMLAKLVRREPGAAPAGVGPAATVSAGAAVAAGGAGAPAGQRLATPRPGGRIGRRPPGPARLSFAQERMWFLEQLEPGSPFYNMPVFVQLRGRLVVAALARALDAVRNRHETLRSRIVATGGEAEQVVDPPRRWPLPLVDLTGLPAAARQPLATALAAREALRPYDLARGPVFRPGMLRLAPERHVLMLSMHHLVSDTWSIDRLLGETVAGYRAFQAGEAPQLPELPIQYADYAAWQREWLEGEVYATQLAHWRERLAGLPAMLELPTDRPRPAVQSFRGASVETTVGAATVARLRALEQREGATGFMVNLAVFFALLFRYTGGRDLAVGTPISGRHRSEIEGLIGFFLNTLVIRAAPRPETRFAAFLAAVRASALDAFAHQDLPFEKLVGELAPERSLSHSPVVQVVYVHQTFKREAATEVAGLWLEEFPVTGGVSKFDLTFHVGQRESGLEIQIEYADALFDATTMQRFARHWSTLLEGALADPACPLGRLPLLAAAERSQLLAQWNDTASDYPRDEPVDRRVARRAAEVPDAVALAFGDEQLSYRETLRRAGQLAAALRAAGVAQTGVNRGGAGEPVGLYLERSAELVLATLAVLLAGGAYVPLDLAYPAERLATLIADSGARVIVSRRGLAGELPAAAAGAASPRVLCLDEAIGSPADPDLAGLADEDASPLTLAYLIYTSGSTGKPKGVAVPHRAIVRLVENTDYAQLAAGDRVAQVANTSFDAATFEIWGALANGARLVGIERDVSLSPAALAADFERLAITAAFLTTALFHQIAGEQPAAFAQLTHLLVGGEALDPGAPRRVLAGRPPRRLLNVYGPTESTTFATWQRIHEVPAEARSIPIGEPIANTTLHVLDEAFGPVPIGVAGELCLGGDGLAHGYWRRPGLTAERFVPDPFGPPGARLYRTGDRVRRLATGGVDFLGRNDGQVKIRGFRIELGEIESALAALPEVAEAKVLVKSFAGDPRLVAYWVPAAGADSTPGTALAEALRRRLPENMVPGVFVAVERFPLNANGKIDLRALPEPDATGGEASDSRPPQTPAEQILAGIWAEVLGVARVGREDGFFALGGHSLLGTRVVSRVREAFGVELPLRSLFESPSLEATARAIEAQLVAGELAQQPPVRRIPRSDRERLSFAQERLWFIDQLEPGSANYAIPLALRLRGALRVAALARTLAAVAARHEILRARFGAEQGRPFQVIDPPRAVPLPLVDLSGLAPPAIETEARELATREAGRGFDLARGPVWRARLLRLGTDEHLALFDLHHIVADGWSFGVLAGEIARLYPALVDRGPGESGADPLPEPLLPELPVQYVDFAAWQRERLAGASLEAQLDFWRRVLAGVPPALDLPLDRPREAVQSFRGARVSLPLATDFGDGLAELARRERATPFMLLLAAFEAMLGRFCGQEDFVIGSPVANRGRLELEGLIGLFVNNLALRADLSGQPGFGRPSFSQLVARVRAGLLAAHAHQDLPFERLVEELGVPRSLAHHPLFQVVFTYQARPAEVLELPGLTLEAVGLVDETAKLDLLCGFAETPDGLAGDLQYNVDLFDRTTAERMARSLARLLAAALAAPSRPWSELPLLSAAEEAALRLEWNDRGWLSEAPVGERLDQLFAAALTRSPEAIALASADEQVSYAALAQRAGALATRLRDALAGVAASPLGRPLVGIFLPRGIDFVVAVLAAFQAGAAYLPLDPSHPAERLAFTVADSGAAVVIVKAEARPFGDAVATIEMETDVTGLEPLTGYKELESSVSTDPVAYVIYTSGSTGKPNGVMVPHGAASRLIRSAVGHFGVTATSRLVQVVSTSFDASVLETWMALAAGARLVLPEEEMRRDADALAAFCRCQAVTTAVLTPAVLALLDPAELPGLRNLSVGGESCPPEVVRRWSLDRSLLNCYGPTETTIYATFHRCHDEGEREAPLGLPVEGATAYVLDHRGALVPPGAAGELWLGGLNLARGYLRRPALTAQRFRPDSLGRAAGGRLYATGDRVRRNGSGELEFLGRIDQQVKIRGLRIELGEVEAALQRHPAVAEAVVSVHSGPRGEKALAAYVVPAAGESDLVARLRADLQAALPDYMVPASFLLLESLPRTPTGKLDRRALPAPDAVAGAERVAPRDLLELLIARVWQEVLGLAEVGVRESFFELGGHSLLAVRLLARLRAELGVELPLTALFSAGTVEGLAALVREAPAGGEASLLVPIQPRGGRRPLFLIHPAGGDVLCYAALGPHLGSDQPLYGLRSRGLEAGEEPLDSLAEMAAAYLAEIRYFQPEGPYALGGWSLGGLVAFEMARQLAAAGETVAPLLILDTTAGMVGPAAPSETDLLLDVAAYVETLWGKALGLAREDLDALPSAERVELFVERLRAVDFLPEGAGPETVRRLLAVYAGNLTAAGGYRPEPYGGSLVLLAAAERGSVMDEGPVPAGDGGLLADPSLGWSAVAAEVAVETLPGTHLSLLAEPAVAGLAARVVAWLARTAGTSPAAT